MFSFLYLQSLFTVSLKHNNIWVESDPIHVNTDLKRKVSQSFSLPFEGQLQISILHENILFRLQLVSSVHDKMRMIMISPAVTIINRTKRNLKILPFAVETSEKVDGVKRNDISIQRCQILETHQSNHDHCQGIMAFTDFTKRSKKKFNATFDSFIAISTDDNNMSIPFKVYPSNRHCLNIFGSHGNNFSLAISIVKNDDIFFITIIEDTSPTLTIHNCTDFDLYLAQTDITSSNSKNIQPHREVSDDRFPWHQLVPKKQKVFYTPPIVNETFPEISSPEYGLIMACATANDAVRWSMPLKIDGTKKIIFSLPMFGDICLDVNDQNITTTIEIHYIQQDSEETSANLIRSSRINKEHANKKTHVMNFFRTRQINFKLHVQQINWTISRENKSIISLNVDDILVKYSKMPSKLEIEFAGIQIDNELFSTGNYDFPVIVCNKEQPSKHIRSSIKNIWDISDFIDHSMKGENFKIAIDFHTEVRAVKNISVKLLPIRVYIEDTFITAILEMLEDCLPHNLIAEESMQWTNSECGFLCSQSDIRDQIAYFIEPLKIQTLRIEPLHILISVHTCMR